MEQRDVDGDGLIESEQSGNRGTGAFGDTAWDTYSSGHKNAYVNALAYRAWRGLAALETKLGRAPQAAHYAALAEKLRAAFVPALLNQETGWLGWWRSADGELHDIYSPVPTSFAVECGVLSPDEARPDARKTRRGAGGHGIQAFRPRHSLVVPPDRSAAVLRELAATSGRITSTAAAASPTRRTG